MPEVRLSLQWPDGQTSELYSPSTVILEYIQPGDVLQVAELHSRGVQALQEASERVRARYGFACTRTDEEQVKLARSVAAYDGQQTVTVHAIG